LDTEAFALPRNPELFAQVAVDEEIGTIAWPGGVDLDPSVIYSALDLGPNKGADQGAGAKRRSVTLESGRGRLSERESDPERSRAMAAEELRARLVRAAEPRVDMMILRRVG